MRFDADMNHSNASITQVSNVSKIMYEEATGIRRTGFIAQEVEQAALKTKYNFSGIIKPHTGTDHYSLSYESFVVPMVKAIQEQQVQIEKQCNLIDQQQQELEMLKKRLDKLEKQ